MIDPRQSAEFELAGTPDRADSKASQMGRYRKLLSNSVQLESKGRSRCVGLRNSEVFSTNEKLRTSPMGGDYNSNALFEHLNGPEPVKIG